MKNNYRQNEMFAFYLLAAVSSAFSGVVDDCEIGLGPFMSKFSRFNYIYVTPTKFE